MFPAIQKFARWISIPILLIASMFARFAGAYELPLEMVVWLGVIFLAQKAVRSGEYAWAAGLGVVVIVFSPLLLVDKIFLFMGYTGIATFLTLAAAFRRQPEMASL